MQPGSRVERGYTSDRCPKRHKVGSAGIAGAVRPRHGTLTAFGMAFAVAPETCGPENPCLWLCRDDQRFFGNCGSARGSLGTVGAAGRLRPDRSFIGRRAVTGSNCQTATGYGRTPASFSAGIPDSAGSVSATTAIQPGLPGADGRLRPVARLQGKNAGNRIEEHPCYRGDRDSRSAGGIWAIRQ